MRAALILPLVLLAAACSKSAPAVFPDLTTQRPQAPEPIVSAEPGQFSPAPGVFLKPAEKQVWDQLTEPQRAVVLEYLKNGSTLASALNDEQISGLNS